MERANRIVITIGCAFVILVSWAIVLNSKSPAEKQFDLINRAQSLANVGIYILAVPLLEEAVEYNSVHTQMAEEQLKGVYLQLINNRGYARRYTDLLDKQMARDGAAPEVFKEAAGYYLSTNATQKALRVLRIGIARTEDTDLTAFYENIRYDYDINRTAFEDVTAIYEGTIQVMQEGKWGIAKTDGTIIIPCRYDKISTYYQDMAIVKTGGDIYAVDSGNNRIAIVPDGTLDFRNINENRTALLTDDGWHRATSSFETGASSFEDIGMYSGGYAPAMTDGKWGVIGTGNEWLIPAQYDEIIQDKLGRCFGQDAVFVRSGEYVYLISGGYAHSTAYQDARPFDDEGYAAVKLNGKWGFIDNEGNVAVGFIFDDALSFSGHLAAVKIGDLWGYVSVSGKVVIDAVFLDARSFSAGSAPVLTERGWQIITLTEYKKERGLL